MILYKKELPEAEALKLALEYRLVTPLTSMIIIQSQDETGEQDCNFPVGALWF